MVFFKSPLSYNIVDWFVIEVIKLESKMAFYFKNTTKNIILTEEYEEDSKNNDLCRFCEKKP